MSERDANRFADRLAREADELERRSDELQDRVKQVGDDWKRKRGDQSIPGAPPPEGSEGDAQDEASPESKAPLPDADDSEAEPAAEDAAGPPSDADE